MPTITRPRLPRHFAWAMAIALGWPSAFAMAMPVAPAPVVAPDRMTIAGGCGPGAHRGPYGGCLRNYAKPALHACPRGFHVGPGGRCRGNGR
jgi:hypothetical protein